MTRIRGGRGIAQVCGRNETSRTAREPGRRRHGADETNRHDCGADEPGARGRAGPRARTAGTACSGAGVGPHRESGAPYGAAGALTASGGPCHPPARGTDWRTNPEQVAGRGTDARGTKARAHTTPQDGPARGRRREHDDPGPGRRARASEAGAATARIGRDGCVTPLDRSRPGGHGGPGRTRRTRRDGSRRGIGQRGTQRLHGFGADAG